MKQIFDTQLAGYGIGVYKQGSSYTVYYGLQAEHGLTRQDAHRILGEFIFHGLECEGKLDEE